MFHLIYAVLGMSVYTWTVSTEPFEDEVHPRLRFPHRGLVACANNGAKNSNDSQFFITLGSFAQFCHSLLPPTPLQRQGRRIAWETYAFWTMRRRYHLQYVPILIKQRPYPNTSERRCRKDWSNG